MATDHLKTKLTEAEKLKGMAQAALLTLHGSHNNVFTPESKTEANDAKRDLISFIRSTSKELKDRETRVQSSTDVQGVSLIQEPPRAREPLGAGGDRAEATRAFKAERVRRYVHDLSFNIRGARDEIAGIGKSKPNSDIELRVIQERFQTAMKRSGALKIDAKSLIDDAVDAGIASEVVELDSMVRLVKDVEWEVETTINEFKMSMGMVGVPTGNSARDVDLKPPLFSGELSELDFYTFKTEFEEYISLKLFLLLIFILIFFNSVIRFDSNSRLFLLRSINKNLFFHVFVYPGCLKA